MPARQGLWHRTAVPECRESISHPGQWPSLPSKWQLIPGSHRASSETRSLPEILSQHWTRELNLRQIPCIPLPREVFILLLPEPTNNLVTAHQAGVRGRQAAGYHRKCNQIENSVFTETPYVKTGVWLEGIRYYVTQRQ